MAEVRYGYLWVGLAAMLLAAPPALGSDGASIAPVNYGAWDVDLSGEGAVAISRSADGKHALILYCRMDDGVARVWIGGLGEALDATRTAIADAGGIDAFGRIVGDGAVSVSTLGSAFGIDIAVEGFHPDFVRDEDDLFVGDESGERATSAAYPAIHVPVENAVAAFAVALRNCV